MPIQSEVISVKPMQFNNDGLHVVSPSSPDKSMTHRALMLSAMACGKSVIRNPLLGSDCLATKNALEACGVSFQSATNSRGMFSWHVDSPGLNQLRSPKSQLDLGNSGTGARLLLGLLSGIEGFQCLMTGDSSLRSRPMARVADPLRNMGADIQFMGADQKLPLTITGHDLLPRTHRINVASAQIKSAILFAAASSAGETVIEIPEGGRDHTETMMLNLGASLRRRAFCGRESIVILGPWRPNAFESEIPNDPSSAAFFAALASMHKHLKVTSKSLIYNPTRIGFFKKLVQMGVQVRWALDERKELFFGECVGDVEVERISETTLLPVHVKSSEVVSLIDEIPILAVASTFAEGESIFEGLQELRVKETDRVSEVVKLLTAAGVRVQYGADWLKVQGIGNQPVNAFSFGSEDHRLVMAAMILATRANGPSQISGLSWITTSFPLFLEAFQNITSSTNKNFGYD